MRNSIILAVFISLSWGITSLVQAASADESFTAGKKYYEQYLYDKAAASFQDAVSQEPTYWEAYQMLSYSYYHQGKRDSALEAANKSLLIHGDNAELKQFMNDHLKHAEMSPAPGAHSISGVSEASTAETRVENSLLINLGGSVPMSPSNFTSTQNVGYNLGLGFGIGITKQFQVILDANMDTYSLNSNSALYSGSTVTGGGTRYWTFLVNGRVRLTPENTQVIPYAIGGAGLGLVVEDDLTSTSGGTATNFKGSQNAYFTGRVGLGLEFKLSTYASLFVEPDGYIVFSGNNSGSEDLLFGSFRLGTKFNL